MPGSENALEQGNTMGFQFFNEASFPRPTFFSHTNAHVVSERLSFRGLDRAGVGLA